jgi:kynurenine 3-monooxygenase
MTGTRNSRTTLIGGGLGGALLATYLGQAGYEVDLYERRPDPAAGNMIGGRSINLAISVRGLHALREVGLADETLRSAIPMRGRMIHGPRGDLHFQPYDKDPTRCINSMSRAGLNAAMLAAAQRCPGVRVHFNCRCVDVDLEEAAAEIVRADPAEPGRAIETLRTAGDVLIGIDGAYSAVRRAMQRLDRFDYEQCYLPHGYKELSIPPAGGGGFRMEPHALHIWPRRSYMMIALPNPDGSFTCTLFYHFEGPESFAELRSDEDVRRFFEQQFPDAVPLMPTLLGDFRANPTGSMITVRASPWYYRDRVALVGDAAHAVVPFYGQGANAAFEDCTVLSECVGAYAPNWGRVFAEYHARRKPHVDALANLALENFIEMRDKTGSRAFRAYKKLDRTLHRSLPGIYTPLYTMVSFTRTPYADAVRRARLQDRVLTIAAVVAAVALLTGLFAMLRSDRLLQHVTTAALLIGAVGAVIQSRRSRARAELRRIGVRDAQLS